MEPEWPRNYRSIPSIARFWSACRTIPTCRWQKWRVASACRPRRAGGASTDCRGDGVIRARVALLDRKAINAGVTVFVAVRTAQHNAALADALRQGSGIVSRGHGLLSHERRDRLSDPPRSARYRGLRRVLQAADRQDRCPTSPPCSPWRRSSPPRGSRFPICPSVAPEPPLELPIGKSQETIP